MVSFNWTRIRQEIKEEANFFRLHLLYFLSVPLIAAGIFYGANGEFHIAFIDSLFLCYSALTVTGLSTINLSTATPFQQAVLYVLMLAGDVTVVAWVMVLIRKHYFRQYVLAVYRKKMTMGKILRTLSFFGFGTGNGQDDIDVPKIQVQQGSVPLPSTGLHSHTGTERIKAKEGIGAALAGGGGTGLGLGIALGGMHVIPNFGGDTNAHQTGDASEENHTSVQQDRLSLANRDLQESPQPMSPTSEVRPSVDERGIIADAHSFTSSPRSGAVPLPMSPISRLESRTPRSPYFTSPDLRRRRPGVPIPRRRTIIAPQMPYVPYDPTVPYSQLPVGQRPKDQGLGGFPGPIELGKRLAGRMFPHLYRNVVRPFIISEGAVVRGEKRKWLSETLLAGLVIGRNSDFNTDELTDEQLEELGGIEYRALRFLSYLVILYFIGVQLISFTLIAPWLSSTHEYDSVFENQSRLVNKSWFVLFQVAGAYTGGGMSLVDEGMVPFQRAYLMIFAMIFAILAGNHGLPIFLRFLIWISTKLVKEGSKRDQALHFLLDHPRRCFLYLFPSHVTWFLLATLVIFTAIEWCSFIVLDRGLSVVESLPPGTRAVAGLFQSFAVRASGFSIVSLAALAPSFQFLCIVMMYIAVYPVALSIRSTNVYEEKSLGVFEMPPEDEDEEPVLSEQQSRRERIGKYFGWHLRRQVAFDIWWLVCAIFLVCIIERGKIMDDVNAPWFNVFTIIFELVSAFGGIGLSLGIPTQNYSFSGAFGPLSKLVVIVIMIRGRHRGLPFAIDRAILLPEDLIPNKPADARSQQGELNAQVATTGPEDDLAERGRLSSTPEKPS
ncbi:TrkH-domain-containing protein [Obba rivulosa]|uniref:Potassium transport protein n=1 Tax=Obba rivulosa TaxID=1052685 RepID=A0A8E2DR52_9APHY|nr:TrkH-domain-containing protein [Obba rivulosa]